MSAFTKLDSGIVHSTIWVQPHDVLRVWIALLALADQHGFARTAAPSLANLCMIPVDRMREILTILESPDEDSRSAAEEGRRIVKVEGGWMLVNHAAYRAKRDPEADKERKREWDRQHRPSGHARQSDAVRHSPTQSDSSPPNPTQAEAEAYTEAREEQKHVQPAAARSRFDDFWLAYPNKKGKQEAEKTWRKRKLDGLCDDLIAHVQLMQLADDGWQRGYVPMGSTYLNQARWEDEPKPAPSARAGPSVSESKTLTGMKQLQDLKNGSLVQQRNHRRTDEAHVLELGSDACLRLGNDHGGHLD